MSKRSFVKAEAFEEEKRGTAVKVSAEKGSAPVVSNGKYTKGDAFENPQTFIIIVSGGEVREKDYFKHISTSKFPNIKVEFIAEPTNPLGLVYVAMCQCEKYIVSQSLEAPDHYYLISDVDHFYDDLIKIKPACKALNFDLIISNSCFEVWLYYSRTDDKFSRFVKPDDPLKISSAMKSFLNEDIPGGCNPAKAIFNIWENIENSIKNYEVDNNGIPQLYSTNMHELAKAILPYIEADLVSILERNEARAERERQKRGKCSE
ncbi:MAG: RloB family protein [Tannerellaceae bacterium]